MDKSYRDSIAEEISVFKYVKKDVFEKKNKDKSWEYKKYPDIDPNFIVISKDGTINDVLYKVGGLIIAIPNPKDKEVLNKGKSGLEAKWKRTPIPKEFLKLEDKYAENIKEAPYNKTKAIRDVYISERRKLMSKYKDFIEHEYYRRKYGIFIIIDEKMFYLTGSNYMFLNYYYLTDSDMYPLFRTTAVYTWLHWEAVKADKDLWGEIRFKSRRVTWTSEAASIAIDEMTITRYGNIPVVSERKDLAKELFQTKIVDAFKYYPTYFKPVINNPNELVKTTLEITLDSTKRETSKITTYPTKVTAYDSTRVKPFAINDEIFKPEDMDFSEFRSRHKHCYNKSAKLHPKGKFGSTVGDKATNTENAIYEWENADPNKRDKTGKTGTGLCALFVDTCFTDGENAMFDEWGYPIVHDPILPIVNEVGNIVEYGSISLWKSEEYNKKKGKKTELNSFYRNRPRVIEHCLREEGGINNNFNIDNLNTHLDYLNNIDPYELKQIVHIGDLVFEGEMYNSDVIWKPNPNGKFKTTWIPDKDMRNKYSKRMFHGHKVLMPDNNEIGAFGVDSYDIIGKPTERGSNGAIVGFAKNNLTDAPSNSFFLIYNERPEKRNDFYDDVIKVALFYGMFLNIESNKPRLLEYIYDLGFTGFVQRRKDKKWKYLTKQEKLWGGTYSTTETVKDDTSNLQDYIMDYIGGENVENNCKVYFPELIKEWIKYKPHKRKEFDLGVASGLAKTGAQYRHKFRKVPDEFKKGKYGRISISDFGA